MVQNIFICLLENSKQSAISKIDDKTINRNVYSKDMSRHC